MTLRVDPEILRLVRRHGEDSYPEEGAGLLLGRVQGELRLAIRMLPLANRAPAEARQRRYQIDPVELMAAEDSAETEGQEVVGVFHSHPDHPPAPSEHDRRRAVPWYSYLITSVVKGKAAETRCWRPTKDGRTFEQERLEIGLPEGIEKEEA